MQTRLHASGVSMLWVVLGWRRRRRAGRDTVAAQQLWRQLLGNEVAHPAVTSGMVECHVALFVLLDALRIAAARTRRRAPYDHIASLNSAARADDARSGTRRQRDVVADRAAVRAVSDRAFGYAGIETPVHEGVYLNGRRRADFVASRSAERRRNGVRSKRAGIGSPCRRQGAGRRPPGEPAGARGPAYRADEVSPG